MYMWIFVLLLQAAIARTRRARGIFRGNAGSTFSDERLRAGSLGGRLLAVIFRGRRDGGLGDRLGREGKPEQLQASYPPRHLPCLSLEHSIWGDVGIATELSSLTWGRLLCSSLYSWSQRGMYIIEGIMARSDSGSSCWNLRELQISFCTTWNCAPVDEANLWVVCLHAWYSADPENTHLILLGSRYQYRTAAQFIIIYFCTRGSPSRGGHSVLDSCTERRRNGLTKYYSL